MGVIANKIVPCVEVMGFSCKVENTVQIDYMSGVTHDVGLALKKIHNKQQGGKNQP